MPVDLSEYAEPDTAAAGADLSQYAVPDERPGIQEFDVSSMRQPPSNVRQPGYAPADLATNIAGIFTGDTRREFDLPEFDLPFEVSARQAKTAAGLMSTFDPQREMQVLKSNYPDLKFAQDKFGNIIADGTAYGGGTGYINNPGLSARDVLEAGYQIAAFTPAGRAGAVATTTGGRMAAVGGTAAATEAAMDETARAMAGQPTGLGGVDKGNVAIAGIGGGVFEGLGTIIGKSMLPAWQASRGEVTPAIRIAFQQEALNAGLDPQQLNDDVIRFYMEAAQNAVDPAAVPAVRDTSEFGIRYTKGQAEAPLGADTQQLRLEERLRTGPSEAASGTMNRFRDQQGEQIMAARGQVQGDIAGQHPVIRSQAEAGEAVLEGTRGRSRAALGEIDEAYGDIGQASLLPQGQRGLVTRMERTARANQFITDTELAPATARAMQDVRALREYIDERGNLLGAQPMRHIERLRRRLNKFTDSAKTKEDQRQMLILKREFDSYLDRAVDNALFSGDQDALTQLKKARGLHAAYMKKFTQQYNRGRSGQRHKVGAGDVIERIVEADPTAEQVINYVFGLSRLGGKERGAQIARQFLEVLGEDSAEWSALRQGAFLKLTDPGKANVISGAKFMTNITDAQNRSGTLLKTLFTPEEVQTLNRFARAVSRAQPAPFNPSGTAAAAAGYINDLWRSVLTMFGAAQAGPVGGVAANKGFVTLTGLRDWMNAQGATRASQVPLRRMGAAGAIGAPASVGAFGD